MGAVYAIRLFLMRFAKPTKMYSIMVGILLSFCSSRLSLPMWMSMCIRLNMKSVFVIAALFTVLYMAL